MRVSNTEAEGEVDDSTNKGCCPVDSCVRTAEVEMASKRKSSQDIIEKDMSFVSKTENIEGARKAPVVERQNGGSTISQVRK